GKEALDGKGRAKDRLAALFAAPSSSSVFHPHVPVTGDVFVDVGSLSGHEHAGGDLLTTVSQATTGFEKSGTSDLIVSDLVGDRDAVQRIEAGPLPVAGNGGGIVH